eukprot:INCI19267.2.p1 GENE.INCI19267.2~~INCI19267.2.p1  ORF type:complete len:683 (-),score=140.23 INCI19267.2:559-2607(-)
MADSPLSSNDDEKFIRKHSSKRARCGHMDAIHAGLQKLREYAQPEASMWGQHWKESGGLEVWVSKSKDFSMGRIVIDAHPDLVADAVTANELRLTFDENLRGHTRVVEFEDIVGNIMGGYDYTFYRGVWPVASRDFALISYRFKDTDGIWWTPTFSVEVPDIIPEDQEHGRIRAELFTAGYRIEPFGPAGQQARVTFLVHCDMKGKIPGMMIKILVKAQPTVCKRVREFFADERKVAELQRARPTFRKHPDIHVTPGMYERGSFDRMMAERSKLELEDKAEAEERARAAALAASQAEAEEEIRREEQARADAAKAEALDDENWDQEQQTQETHEDSSATALEGGGAGAPTSKLEEGNAVVDAESDEHEEVEDSPELAVFRKLLRIFQAHVPETSVSFRVEFAAVLEELQGVLEDHTAEFEAQMDQLTAGYEARLAELNTRNTRLAAVVDELRAAMHVDAPSSPQFYVKDGLVHSYELPSPNKFNARPKAMSEALVRPSRGGRNFVPSSGGLHGEGGAPGGRRSGMRSQSEQVRRSPLQHMVLERIGRVLLGRDGFTAADLKAVHRGAHAFPNDDTNKASSAAGKKTQPTSSTESENIVPATQQVSSQDDCGTDGGSAAGPRSADSRMEEFYKGILSTATRNHDAQVETLVHCLSRERQERFRLEAELQELRRAHGLPAAEET